LSIQEAVEGIFKEVFNAEEVIIHAAGREDVDARMLGSGRPLVVEVKAPKRRKVELNELRSSVMRSLANIPVVLHIDSQTTRSSVALIKEYSKRKRKIYRLTVFVDGELGEDDLRKIEEYFANREIVQRTPIRILKRKKDRERRRKVYSVKTHRISSRIFEALVYCDGGLYVKELVHCDEGRTKPCFSEILAKKTVPIELDVLYVEE
jgi:Predicted pseudouridylate synthase